MDKDGLPRAKMILISTWLHFLTELSFHSFLISSSVSNSTKPESSTCPSTADSASSPASSTTNDFTASVPAATNVAPVPAAIIPPTTGGISSVKSGLQPGVPLHSSASSERLASLRHPNVGGDRRQADPYFAQEFPQLSATTTAGGNSTQPQSAKDLSNQRQGSRGGHVGVGGQQHLRDRDDPPLPGAAATSHRPIAVGNNQAGNSYNYKDTGPPGAEDDISLLGTSNNSSTLDGPFNANSSSRQSGRNKSMFCENSIPCID